MKKLDFGFTTVLNEEECLTAWIKQALFFCEKVVVLIDPLTFDRSFKIVDEFTNKGHPVTWLLQDRSLGDSDRTIEGKQKVAIWHANQNMFMERIPLNAWFLFCDTDEIMNPRDWTITLQLVNQIRESDYKVDGILQPKIEFYPDDQHIINWKSIGLDSVLHCIFHKRTAGQSRNTNPHGYITFPQKQRTIGTSIYHYTHLKKDAKPRWYDYIETSDMNTMIKRYGSVQTVECPNPIQNWRTLEGEG